MIIELSNNDITKVNEVTKQNAVFCLNILTMKKKRNEIENEISKELYK